MYQIAEISNRDVSILHQYRILRNPSDFLSAVYNDGTLVLTSIKDGFASEFETDDGRPVYGYDLGIQPVAGFIPYLEFETDNESDKKQLESLLYLDGMTIYGLNPSFQDIVSIRVYWVSSLESIRIAIANYQAAIGELQLGGLRDQFDDRRNRPRALRSISGRENNLVQFTEGSGRLTMKDSDYMITSALEAQLLVNPDQALLMSLPRVLNHSINISITDGRTRYLSSFSGYTINIRGNGNWCIRDMNSGINFVSGSGKIHLWNCRLVHFRTAIEGKEISSNSYICSYLYAHRSLIVLNQGKLSDVYLVGGTTLWQVSATSEPVSEIENIELIGHGCSAYSWVKPLPVKSQNILGTAWWNDLATQENILYMAGRRIDEISGHHDEELKPSQIVEYDADNIHISQEGS